MVYSDTTARITPAPVILANWSHFSATKFHRISTAVSGNIPFLTSIVAQKHSHHMEAFSQPASKCYTYDPEMSVYRVQLVSSVIEIEVTSVLF